MKIALFVAAFMVAVLAQADAAPQEPLHRIALRRVKSSRGSSARRALRKTDNGIPLPLNNEKDFDYLGEIGIGTPQQKFVVCIVYGGDFPKITIFGKFSPY